MILLDSLHIVFDDVGIHGMNCENEKAVKVKCKQVVKFRNPIKRHQRKIDY